MNFATLLKINIDKIVKIFVYFALGASCLLIWHFSAHYALQDGNSKETILNHVIFKSPNYPDMHIASPTVINFLINNEFAGIKVHFDDWDMYEYANSTDEEDPDFEETVCEKFSVRFTGFNFPYSEELCGSLKGYTILVDRNFNSEEMQKLEIHIYPHKNNFQYRWKLSVSQISQNEVIKQIPRSISSRKRRRNVLWQNEEEDANFEAGETPLVANGDDTDISNVPWQVSIRDMSKLPVFAQYRNCSLSVGRHFCGGSLISDTLIISAAHCFFSSWSAFRPLSSLRIIVGDSFTCAMSGTDDQNKLKQIFEIQSVYVHYGFDIATFRNDIVLIRLKNSVVFNNAVQPIGLSKEDFTGKSAYISGWGRTIISSSKSYSNTLKYGRVVLSSNELCTEEYPSLAQTSKNLTRSILCSKLTSVTSGPGRGDSGGGLYYSNSEEEFSLIGVTSFILPERNLSYFQSLAFFENWIKLASHF